MSSSRRGNAAAPAAGVVAADDRALGECVHLLVEGEGQGRVERPGDRPAAAARAYRPRRSSPQPVDIGLKRDDRQRGGVGVHDRDRIGIRGRALGDAKRRCSQANRGCDEVGADGARVVLRYLDLHGLGPVTRLLQPSSKIPLGLGAL